MGELQLRTDILRVCDELRKIVDKAEEACHAGQYDSAASWFSNVYIIGLGRVQDDIRRFREPGCKHKHESFEATRDGAWAKCTNCGRQRKMQ